MKRLHLFEIHDQDWCPRAIRDAVTLGLEIDAVAVKVHRLRQRYGELIRAEISIGS